MNVEIKTPTKIEITPDTHLDDSIIRSGEWTARVEHPKPLDINQVKIVLERTDVKP